MRWMLPLAAVAACALVAPSAQAYEKRVVAVYEAPNDPFARGLRRELEGLGRLQVIEVPASAYDSLEAFLARARAALGASNAPAYAFVPRHAFGPMTSTAPTREETLEDGLIQSTVASEIRSRFAFDVDIYELASGRRVTTLSYHDTLSRRFEYRYDSNDSEQTLYEKAQRLSSALSFEARRTPAEAFASQARSAFAVLGARVVHDLRSLDAFALRAEVTGWDARRDRVFLGLGYELDARLDDGFKIFQGEREVGYVKLRDVGASASEAQPVFLDATLRQGDRLVEHPKHHNWQGLKAGITWMGGPALVGTYSAELDFGRWIGVSELYGTLDASLLNTGAFSGRMGEMGLAKRFFVRRWGFGVGARFGGASLTGLTGDAFSWGGAGVLSLVGYLTPDFIWTNELGFQLYSPVLQAGGAADGLEVQPFGPVAKTGLSFVF